MTEPMPPEIVKAICAAQKLITAVHKDSTNEFQRYKYASAESMMREAKAALEKVGLSVCDLAHVVNKDDGKAYAAVTRVLLHDESGKMYELPINQMPCVPDKGRPDDKAFTTALTYDIGYFLRGFLFMPRVEKGTDVDQRDDRDHDNNSQSIEALENLLLELDKVHTKIDFGNWTSKVTSSKLSEAQLSRLREASKKKQEGLK